MTAAWVELSDLVEEAQAGGAYIPCRAADMHETAIWTSDVDSDQQKAADGCYECPLFTTCRRAAIESGPDEMWGVMGGMTVRERTEIARTKKES